MSERADLLVVAVSARMLAELAVAAGYSVTTLDRFGDADLRALCPGRSIDHELGGRGRMADLVELAEDVDADAVVYGGGFEHRPELVARLARGRRLLGTAPAALSVLSDPRRLAGCLKRAGVAMPETMPAESAGHAAARDRAAGGRATDDATGRWLRKPRHGGGGRGVRRWRGGALRPSEILQREIAGLPCSAVALGDGRRGPVLGLTEQLVGEPRLGARGFAWCGNVSPPRLAPGQLDVLDKQLRAAADAVVAEFGVVGVFGIDAIWDGERAWVIEVNARPPAGLEVVDAVRGGGTFAAHVAACGGAPPAFAGVARTPGRSASEARDLHAPPACPDAPVAAAGKAVVYASRDVLAPPLDWWPAHVRDVPHPAQRIPRGRPVCTVTAAGDDAAAVAERLFFDAEVLALGLPAPVEVASLA